MRRVVLLSVMLVATGATGPWAQSDTTIVSNITHLSDTIVVTANRLRAPIKTIGSAITVITAEQIAASQAAMATDLLRAVPGISIVQSGGQGQQTSLFMRGANSEHVLVLIDGVELNDPSSPNRAANLANIPTDNIERIEILRGPQSVLYGSDAVAGVVQIFTKRGVGKPTVTLATEGGSFNTFTEQLAIRAGQNDIDYSLTLSRRDSDGISAASSHRGNTEADGYSSTTLSAGLGLRPSPLVELRFLGRLLEADTDLDQSDNLPDDPDFVLNSKERFLSARLTHQPANSVWSHKIGIYNTHFMRVATDKVDYNRPYTSSDAEYDGRSTVFDWQHLLDFEDIGRVTVGVESEHDDMEQTLLFVSQYGSYRSNLRNASARNNALYAAYEFDVADSWFGSIGARQDDHNRFGSQATYRLTTAFHVNPLGVKLRAAYGTSFKAPSLVQLFDDATGNLGLRPETSEGWELGADWLSPHRRWAAGMTVFHVEFDELIQWQSVMTNVAAASIRGGELFALMELPRLTIRLDYTNTRTRSDESGGLALLRRPRHKLHCRASADLTERLLLNLDIDHKGRRADMYYPAWPNLPERVILNDYTTVDMGAAYQLTSSLRVYGRLDNIFDVVYEEVLFFGSPPRSAFVGVSLSN